MQITLYHLSNSRSQRILWLFEELEIDYRLVTFNTSAEAKNIKDIPIKVQPLKFPTLSIKTEYEEFYLSETSAIVDFVSQSFSRLTPSTTNIQKQANHAFWKNYADASFMPNLALKQIFGQIAERTPFPVRWISWCLKYGFDQGFLNQAINHQLDLINSQLENQSWIIGEHPTQADFLLWFPLMACKVSHPNMQQYPHIELYLEQLQNTASFQRALIKGQWSEMTFKHYWQKAW